MYRIERAVSDWHRVYTRLCAARDGLRRAEAAPPADPAAAGEDLMSQLDRLQDEEAQALRAIGEALSSARKRAGEGGAPPRGDPAP